MSARFYLLFAAVALAAVNPTLVSAAGKSDESHGFVRLRCGDDGKPVALETAIARFAATGCRFPGVTVDLIGAIHIADETYYDELNRRFQTYEAVLYELVAPPDARVPRPGQRTGSPVGGLQVGMTSLLDLEFQLDGIDYSAQNLVHADMSPREFADSMRQRNESWLGTFFRIMGRGFAEQAKDPFARDDWKLLAAMFAEDRAYQMKLALAEQFADLEGEMSLFDGPEGSTIVTERNRKALEVLAAQIKHGRKRIAIFYGAGHLPDMQRRLIRDFGMQRIRTEWLAAWSLVRKDSRSDE